MDPALEAPVVEDHPESHEVDHNRQDLAVVVPQQVVYLGNRLSEIYLLPCEEESDCAIGCCSCSCFVTALDDVGRAEILNATVAGPMAVAIWTGSNCGCGSDSGLCRDDPAEIDSESRRLASFRSAPTPRSCCCCSRSPTCFQWCLVGRSVVRL